MEVSRTQKQGCFFKQALSPPLKQIKGLFFSSADMDAVNKEQDIMRSLLDPGMVDHLLQTHDAVMAVGNNRALRLNPLLDEILNYPSIAKQATGALAFSNTGWSCFKSVFDDNITCSP